MNKTSIIVGWLITAILFAGLFISFRQNVYVTVQPTDLGAAAGTTHTNAEVFLSRLTAGCLRVYQANATTNASTTYYVVASTTVSAGNGYYLMATSTRPTNCPVQ